MGFGDWLRRVFASPVESAEEQAVLREEFGERYEEPSDPRLTAHASPPGTVMPGLPGSQGEDAAEAEHEDFEPPPDPAP